MLNTITPLDIAFARWDGTDWQPLGTGMENGVDALTVYNGELIAGGGFITAGGKVSARWARWGPVSVAADFDGDCDVDADDFALFTNCASGPAIPLDSGCEGCDLDRDGDVDQIDFGIFQRCYSGEGNPADPDCID